MQPHTARKSGWFQHPKVSVILTDSKWSSLISPCTAVWSVFLNLRAKTFCHFWSITLILTIRLPLAFGKTFYGSSSTVVEQLMLLPYNHIGLISRLYSPPVCVGSPQVLQLPPTVRKHAHYWRKLAPRCEWMVCVSGKWLVTCPWSISSP